MDQFLILSCLVHCIHLHVCPQQHLHRFVVALPGMLKYAEMTK